MDIEAFSADTELVDNGIKPDSAYGFIYETTDNLSGIKYIGQRKFYGTWRTYLGSGIRLTEAIKNSGRESFTRRCIDVAYSREELDEKEIYWISFYDAVDSEEYYNIASGGVAGYIFSELNPERKKEIYDRVVAKRRENGSYNYPKGSEHAAARPIICITTGEIFGSIIDAEEKTGIRNLSSCCSGKRFHAGVSSDGRPLRWAYYDKENCSYEPPRSLYERCQARSVLQYSMDGEFIARYLSAHHAEDVLGIGRQEINYACTKVKKSAGGYIWFYDGDDIVFPRYERRHSKENDVAGVCYVRSKDRWKARININKTVLNLGDFKNRDDAVRARLRAEVEHLPVIKRQTWLYEKYGFTQE